MSWYTRQTSLPASATGNASSQQDMQSQTAASHQSTPLLSSQSWPCLAQVLAIGMPISPAGPSGVGVGLGLGVGAPQSESEPKDARSSSRSCTKIGTGHDEPCV